jgi:hypothetical protein
MNQIIESNEIKSNWIEENKMKLGFEFELTWNESDQVSDSYSVKNQSDTDWSGDEFVATIRIYNENFRSFDFLTTTQRKFSS